MTVNPFWGNLIKALREEQGVSQRVLASRAKVNRNTLGRVEACKTSMEIDTMERVLKYFGYELEAIIALEPKDRIAYQASIETDEKRQTSLAVSLLLSLTL